MKDCKYCANPIEKIGVELTPFGEGQQDVKPFHLGCAILMLQIMCFNRNIPTYPIDLLRIKHPDLVSTQKGKPEVKP